MSDTARGNRRKTWPKFLGFDVTLDWLTRPIFGLGLAVLAVAATYYGDYWFAAFVAIGCCAAAREWHRMKADEGYGWFAIVSSFAIVATAFSAVLFAHSATFDKIPWLVLAIAAFANFVLASVQRTATWWHTFGIIYIGVPTLSLVSIREASLDGRWLLLSVFVAVWATDTGALFCGNLFKGPKLWPALSPNKTWAGFLGGTFCGGLGAALAFFFLHGSAVFGAFLGVFTALVGHSGDLFESWVKRQVGRKDSGSLIPGHGGVLDRIDSILFVAPVAAFVFLTLHINPLAGAATP